jgi:hypothetical protein
LPLQHHHRVHLGNMSLSKPDLMTSTVPRAAGSEAARRARRNETVGSSPR